MSNNRVFLDTNFLVAYCIPKHENFKKSRILFARFRKENYNLHISPLCVYELWWAIRKHHNSSAQNYFKKNSSYRDIISKLETITEKILNSEFIKIESIEKDNILIALRAIKDFDQKPGDAFHFSTMKRCDIDEIATYDNGFKRMGLKIIRD